ncbi:hypothetical protein [Micromonospora sp. NPDC092111]|uniref:hypothetical protein n=1 Tax=Micromonospora sp. NPDC092111 TaxID=3364289 RepID=UPI0037FE0838
MRVFADTDELAAAVGQTLGPGPWQRIEQARVDRFADATDDARLRRRDGQPALPRAGRMTALSLAMVLAEATPPAPGHRRGGGR